MVYRFIELSFKTLYICIIILSRIILYMQVSIHRKSFAYINKLGFDIAYI